VCACLAASLVCICREHVCIFRMMERDTRRASWLIFIFPSCVIADLQAKYEQTAAELHRISGTDMQQTLTAQAIMQTQKEQLEEALRGATVTCIHDVFCHA